MAADTRAERRQYIAAIRNAAEAIVAMRAAEILCAAPPSNQVGRYCASYAIHAEAIARRLAA